MYVQRIYEIVGYTYRADNYCPSCMEEIALDILKNLDRPQFAGLLMSPEELLTWWADHHGIERENEATFDSGVFPKVILGSMVEPGERCGKCGEEL